HSHLYLKHFREDIDAVEQRAREVLDAIYLPNVDLKTAVDMHALTDRDPSFYKPMMGLHPCSVPEDYEPVLEQIKAHLDSGAYTYYGIGETGLDLYWDKTSLERQQAALRVHVQWAKDYELPIILHARDAIDETTDLIEAGNDAKLSGIFHCFDGSIEQAKRIIALGDFYIGIGGIVTYRKDVQAMAAELPLDRVVLETDSPYLPPEPHRRDKPRRNESSYTRYVGEKIAELHGISYEEVARITGENVKRLFPAISKI
ncbi:MAG: TatD family hydrolase, partial [Bacteroidia bacterium]